MKSPVAEPEGWKRLVLQGMPQAAWLTADGADRDCVVSTRVRFARNLEGFRYPTSAPLHELTEVQALIRMAIVGGGIGLKSLGPISAAERDHLTHSRLISPDFGYREFGREVWVDESWSVSLMVNEEDHIRLQALAPGWSLTSALALARLVGGGLEQRLRFAKTPTLGFLTSSPSNCGSGVRTSTMMHLLGLAFSGRLEQIMRAVAAENVVVRGLFGEHSRAVGWFFQLSTPNEPHAAFRGACEFVMEEERRARNKISDRELKTQTQKMIRFGIVSRAVSYSDTLRILSWVRWASARGLEGFPKQPQMVDAHLAKLELTTDSNPEIAAQKRGAELRPWLESMCETP